MTTISFCILDDLCPCYGPIHITLDSEKPSVHEIEKVVNSMIGHFEQYKYDKYWDNSYCTDCSGYFDKEFFNRRDQYVTNIAKTLLNEGYYVVNRYNKYYVIAFALNYTRFEIYSKDCDKQLIEWREDDENDPITGLIQNNNYNENPVITLLKMYNNPNI